MYKRQAENAVKLSKYLIAVAMGMRNVGKLNIHMHKLNLLIAGNAKMEDFLSVSNMNILLFKNLQNLE